MRCPVSFCRLITPALTAVIGTECSVRVDRVGPGVDQIGVQN